MSNISLADKYYLKALDNYYYNYELEVEDLSYALSYDDEHARAWCLQGRMQMEILKDFESAKHSFELALLYDHLYVETYKYYTLVLLWTNEFDKTKRLLYKASGIKGMPLSTLQHRWSLYYELQGRIDKALFVVKQSRLLSTDEASYQYFETEIKRLERKMAKPTAEVEKEKKKEVKKARLKFIKALSQIVSKWLF